MMREELVEPDGPPDEMRDDIKIKELTRQLRSERRLRKLERGQLEAERAMRVVLEDELKFYRHERTIRRIL
jgi:hypothetical protein